jgi:hypothetical protein
MAAMSDPQLESDESLSIFQQRFARLREKLLPLQQEARQVALTQAPEYNIFSLLLLERVESINSAILANLLNPDGSHGQGVLFLRTFINHCKRKYPAFHNFDGDIEKGRWTVTPELPFGNGRMDIVAMNSATGQILLIENKIDAPEQPEQIKRYGEWMQRKEQEFPQQAMLYLTITGKEAETAFGYLYTQISYHEDIVSWLEQALEKTQAENVRSIIRQYCDVVRKL